MKKIVQWCQRWPYLVMLILVGAVYLTYSGNWHVYAGLLGRKSDLSQGAWQQESQLGEHPGSQQVSGSAVGTASGEVPDAGKIPEKENPLEIVALGSKFEQQDNTAAQDSTAEPESTELPSCRDLSEVVYVNVEESYFSDALFIGDSRTVGLGDYSTLGETAAFYASTGLTVYKMFDAPIVETAEGKITVEEALGQHQFEKIYLMIGINEMGTGTVESFMEAYRQVVEHLRELQPEAIIYLQGIMKVTAERSQKGDYIHNEGIEARNAEIAKLADNVWIYYLDVNEVLCDEDGGMEASYTYDGVHLKAQYIDIWKDFLKSHAVEKLVLD